MKHIKNWRFSFLIIYLLLFVTLLFPSSALAREAEVEDTVGQGETLDQSLVMYGREVVMDGVINGDLLAVGNRVTINGDINGSLVVIGQNVNLNGTITGSSYIGALNMIMGPEANAARDLYFIGASLETQDGSSIDRDLHAVSLEADLSGTVGQEVDTLVGPVHLIQILYDYMLDQGWLSQPLKFDFPWFQRGFERQAIPGLAFGLPTFQNFMFHTANSASYSEFRDQSSKQAGTIDVERLKQWAVPLLRNLVALLILGLLVLWLLPAQLSFAGEQVRKNPWRSLLTGLLVFVIGWFAALLALLIILALAIFFYWASLPNLGFLTGTIGLSTLGIALSIFWLDIVFFSKIVVAFLCGSLFFKRFLPKYAHRRIWPFLAGVIVYALLASIPYLGWLVAVIVTFLGLGAIWKLSSMRKQPEAQVAEDSPVEEDMPEASATTEA
ncbi:MAG: hypothetical protein A2Z71_04540 [Chloroflexi bacterium RBG_13_50_21]|nr:MAG: hypothetical protein A2Z71_04540 [Chloroflexi bacterium RBG_13_50_21]